MDFVPAGGEHWTQGWTLDGNSRGNPGAPARRRPAFASPMRLPPSKGPSLRGQVGGRTTARGTAVEKIVVRRTVGSACFDGFRGGTRKLRGVRHASIWSPGRVPGLGSRPAANEESVEEAGSGRGQRGKPAGLAPDPSSPFYRWHSLAREGGAPSTCAVTLSREHPDFYNLIGTFRPLGRWDVDVRRRALSLYPALAVGCLPVAR